MPCLPHDPSIFIDEDTIPELVEELSLRLRRNPLLRPVFDRLVGNRWYDFEQELTAFWLQILLQEGGHENAVEAAFGAGDRFEAEHIREACTVFLESSLAVLPFHAAASFTELAERIADVLIEAVGPKGLPAATRRKRLLEAETILKAGAIYR